MSQQSVDSNNQRKRARQANFSPNKLAIITDEVKLRSHVLYSSFSSTVTNQSKMKEWDPIASKLNANSTVPRSGQQIRKKWNDYRSQVKKKAIDFHKETRRLGGCPPDSLSEVEHKVVAMIPSCQIEGISGGVDTEEMSEVQTSSTCEEEPPVEMPNMTANLPVSTASFTHALDNTSSNSCTVTSPLMTALSQWQVLTGLYPDQGNQGIVSPLVEMKHFQKQTLDV